MMILQRQARRGFQAVIDQNKQTISVAIPGDPTDPWSTSTTAEFEGRISHERRMNDLEANPAGLSTNLSYFLIVNDTVDYLAEGQIITDSEGRKWKLGAVDPLRRFGAVIGYQSPLEEA